MSQQSALSTLRGDYAARLDRARSEAAACDRTDLTLANLRLSTFAAILAVAAAVAWWGVPGWVLLVPAIAFCALVVRHARVRLDHDLAQRRVRHHESGIARLDDAWAGGGDPGEEFADPAHPYADHLDVFGRGSLFERISACRTPRGREVLAGWLVGAASPAEIRRRQEAVRELAARADLREDLALAGADIERAADLVHLPDWSEAPPALTSPVVRIAGRVLPAVSVAALLAWGFGPLPLAWAIFPVLVQWGCARIWSAEVGRVLGAAQTPAKDLEVLSALLRRLESEAPSAPLLREQLEAISTGGVPASARIAGLRRRLDLLDAMRNQIFAPIALVLLWPLQMAFALEGWRREHGALVRGWLHALGVAEALSSLSLLSHEWPGEPFPEIVEEGPLLEGEDLGHPLLPAATCVRNDVAFGAQRRVYVVSGSNMSGKSTLLRTVGANAVLALAGGPVRARRLRISPLTVGASIHVHDSLLDGESRFYAEVSRVGRIVALTRSAGVPVLFLMDELFHGTNSHDRRIGAAAVVRAMVGAGAVGLLTTHDLELARIAQDVDGHVVNVHFEDRFEDGRMTFDYRMRPGVVERSNALALMRAVGLDV